jgi:hypothetical protein
LQPRNAGTLQIGSVIYNSKDQVFSVEMLFIAANAFSPEDDLKSAALSAAQHFLRLLRDNGYHDHGPPETVVKPTGPGRVLFYIACKAKKQRPAIIMLRDPNAPMKDDEKKANGGKTNGGE